MGVTRPASSGIVTELLLSWRNGDSQAADRLFTLLYRELRTLARSRLRYRQPGATLDSAALVHETYLKLVNCARVEAKDRSHFFALSSRVMRQVIVDYARRKAARKRGGGEVEPLQDGARAPETGSAEDLIAVDEALRRLEKLDRRLVQLVELRFFGGLSVEETAQALDISPSTVEREWQKARGLLRLQMHAPSGPR